VRPALALILALSACSSSDNKEGPPTTPPTAPTADIEVEPPAAAGGEHEALLGELAAAARCEDAVSPFRPWCIAATGWDAAAVGTLPSESQVLVGLTIELQEGKSVADALTNEVTFSALALRVDGDGAFGKITMVKPESDEESKMVGEAVFGVAVVFKRMAAEAAIPANLVEYLATLPAKADYPITKAATGWTWQGASAAELRKAGEFWVVIETPSQGPAGIFVSIFTDKVAK